MARWKPSNKIEKNEHIGRRLFDEPMLVGTENQKPNPGLDLRNFEEKRDGEISMDRLGPTGVNKKVINYLLPKAIAASKRFNPPKSFDGWVVLPARQLMDPPVGQYRFPVVYSPITDKENEDEENIYHAHVVAPAEIGYYSIALHLRELFVRYGSIYPAPSYKKQPSLHKISLKKRIAQYRKKYFT